MRPHPLAAVVLAASLLAVGCTSDALQALPTPSTTPAATTTPTWQLKPVTGERIPTVYGVSSDEVLGRDEPHEPDTAAIDTMTAAIGEFLDEHLDELQRDGTGRLESVARSPLREALQASEARDVAATALASPEHPVKAARYHIAVYHDGAPQWAAVTVEVVHPDDTTNAATLVFLPHDDGGLDLTFVGPEDGVTG